MTEDFNCSARDYELKNGDLRLCVFPPSEVANCPNLWIHWQMARGSGGREDINVPYSRQPVRIEMLPLTDCEGDLKPRPIVVDVSGNWPTDIHDQVVRAVFASVATSLPKGIGLPIKGINVREFKQCEVSCQKASVPK